MNHTAETPIQTVALNKAIAMFDGQSGLSRAIKEKTGVVVSQQRISWWITKFETPAVPIGLVEPLHRTTGIPIAELCPALASENSVVTGSDSVAPLREGDSVTAVPNIPSQHDAPHTGNPNV